MNAFRKTFRLLVLFFIMFQSNSNATEKVAMAVIGDSISAATFAQTELSEPAHFFGAAKDASSFKWPDIPWLIQNKKTYSWASGKKVQSHFLRLGEYFLKTGQNKTLAVINVSIPGGNSDTLPDQIKELLKKYKKGKFKSLEYVTFLIGGNDLCDLGTKKEINTTRFGNYVTQALKSLSKFKSDSPIKILISAIPNVSSLGRPEIKETKTWFRLSCGYLKQNIIKYCGNMTRWENDHQYQDKLASIEVRNEILKGSASAMETLPNIEIHFTETLFDSLDLSPKHLAFDCFHPSATGQEMISEMLWNDQPWFRY